jgi:hypothetical protein
MEHTAKLYEVHRDNLLKNFIEYLIRGVFNGK